MDWLERLNRGPGQIALGRGAVEVLHWAYQRHLPDNRPHRHTFFEVCQVGGWGAGTFSVEGRPHPLRPGTVFFARPGVVHQIVNTTAPAMELFWVSFQWTPAATDARDEVDALFRAFADGTVPAASDEGGRLAAQWRALRALAEGPPLPGYMVQATALIAALLVSLAQIGAGAEAGVAVEPAGPDARDVAARLAVRYIHDNLGRPLSLQEIAQQVHASPRHLTRLFRQFTGSSPAVYITRARLDRAQGLLSHGTMPIKDVADTVGYPDVHHFTRVFTRHVGCPPGEYRRDPSARPVPNIQSPGDLV